MKRFRILMMMTALLASAATAFAQAPPDSSPPPSVLQRVLDTLQEEADDDAQSSCDAWYVRAAEQTVAAWQRLRALCQSTSCCEMQAKPGVCKAAAGCAVGTAGCAQVNQCEAQGCPEIAQIQAQLAKQLAQLPPCCGIKGFLQMQCPVADQKPAPCACAKGCGCCETCKAKGAKVAQAPQPVGNFWSPPPPWSPAVPFGMPPQPQWGAPAPNWAVPFPQVMPAPRMVIAVTTSFQQTKPAHLVTPELEAHCQRIIHKDGTIILEGNVLLLCKKHAQPIRIEAPRVIVNIKDGSFVVESGAPTVTTNSIGVLRTSFVPAPMMIPLVPSPESMPAHSRIIQVVPVPQEAAPR